MLPPFYYKDVSEEGLYRSFAEVIERVGDARLRIYLYHIPSIAMVGISPNLVERLLKKYPTAIAGMKDSSGDWNNTRTMLNAFSGTGFDVFVGSETFLLANMQSGGAGCISATANVNPAAIASLCREWRAPEAEAQQQAVDVVRKTVGQAVMIPALKAIIAHFSGDPDWATVRPPLTEFEGPQAAGLIDELQRLGFAMPGL
jgi:4-hydroxy-tetrahydrodipicolinate synthase